MTWTMYRSALVANTTPNPKNWKPGWLAVKEIQQRVCRSTRESLGGVFWWWQTRWSCCRSNSLCGGGAASLPFPVSRQKAKNG